MQHSKKLGKFFLAKRESLNISQARLGKLLGYSNGQYISNYERGICPPPLNKIKKLIRILQLDPVEVIEIMQQERLDFLKEQFDVKDSRLKKKA